VLAVAAVLAVPKALLVPVQQALQAHEKQKFLVIWTCICGLLNIGLDFALIPRYAATGAAIASGSAQLIAVLGMCLWASKSLRLKWEAMPIAKIVFAATAMAIIVAFASRQVKLPVNAVLIGVPLGAVCFFVALRLLRALGSEDRDRLLQISERVPAPVRGIYTRTVNWMVVPESIP
jgi:O-antigen/teichoic acid export membrane protein